MMIRRMDLAGYLYTNRTGYDKGRLRDLVRSVLNRRELTGNQKESDLGDKC